MAAGHGTYASALLETAGFRNALPRQQARYPELTEADLLKPGIDVHLFATEPYRFELPRDLGPLAGADVPAILVDGRRLFWYPSLTESGLRYARQLRTEFEEDEP